MLMKNVSHADTGEALGRLIAIADSDTGQSRRIASFLLSWWDGAEGGAPIVDICEVDRELREDMLIIIAYLAENGVTYADAWGRREDMERLIDNLNWKGRGEI
ncbi:DUF7673 family protein [Sphingomonas sp. MMS24-JH45]